MGEKKEKQKHRYVQRRKKCYIFSGIICILVVSLMAWQYEKPNILKAMHLKAVTHMNYTGPHTLPLWWFGHFFDTTGFGIEASSYMLSMKRSGKVPSNMLHLSSVPCNGEPNKDNIQPQDYQDLKSMQVEAKSVLDKDAIVVCHAMPDMWGVAGRKGTGCAPCPPPGYKPAYLVGRAMAETTRYRALGVHIMNHMDEIWVPGESSRQALVESGVCSDVVVVPQAVNTTFFDPAAVTPAFLPQGKLVYGQPKNHSETRPFVFVSVFKWEERKGWQDLLNAYLREFTYEDSVELILVTHPFENEYQDLVQTAKKHAIDSRAVKSIDQVSGANSKLPTMYMITARMSDIELASLYRASNAFVLATHGEGWCRPATEAMSMGLPVIATRWSGLTEFLDDDVGYPVNYRLKRVGREGGVNFPPDSQWAIPIEAHLRSQMRKASTELETTAAKGALARDRMVEKYSPDVIANLLHQHMLRIEEKISMRKNGTLPPPSQATIECQKQASEIARKTAIHGAMRSRLPVVEAARKQKHIPGKTHGAHVDFARRDGSRTDIQPAAQSSMDRLMGHGRGGRNRAAEHVNIVSKRQQDAINARFANFKANNNLG